LDKQHGIRSILIGILVFSILSIDIVQARRTHRNRTPPQKQESSHATDWIASWRTCAGDGAVKRDGSLWQFGRVGGCHWGQIHPSGSKKKYIYHLKGKRIGSGFAGARIINGGYRVYAIKRDGTLWGWGEGLRKKPLQLSRSHHWIDFRVQYGGNGCCSYDIGIQQDGSLWRFPEAMNYGRKDPLPHLRMIGKRRGWERVILDCCSIYATRSDGTLWQNSGLDAKTSFKKINKRSFCRHHARVCRKFKKMSHRSLYSTSGNSVVYVKGSAKGGTLWIDPEVIYP